jgi:hypothetical protein
MVKYLPELKWGDVEIKKVKAYKADSADYQLKIGIRNTGKLPTALRQAHLVKIVKEDRIELEFDTIGSVKGKPGYKVIEDKKNKPERSGRGMFNDMEEKLLSPTATKNIPFTQGGSVTDAIFTIRLYNRQELKGKASMFSTRGGVLKGKDFIIK